MNARGIPPARGCKMLTPPADWPPPHQLDLTPPPVGSLTWPPPAGWTWPPRRLTDLTPPRLDLTPPPGVDRQTKWNYYLPVVLRTRAVIIKNWFLYFLVDTRIIGVGSPDERRIALFQQENRSNFLLTIWLFFTLFKWSGKRRSGTNVRNFEPNWILVQP